MPIDELVSGVHCPPLPPPQSPDGPAESPPLVPPDFGPMPGEEDEDY